MLRFGDVNLDGYPDLTFNVEYTENTSKLQKTVILQNLSCSDKFVDEMKKKLEAFDASKCRYFTDSSISG